MLIRTIDNFLSESECEHIISLIEKENQPSTVVGEGKNLTMYSEARTSSTSNLCNCDNIVSLVRDRISKELNVSTDNMESIQGQMYKPGQFFKQHYDWFAKDSKHLEMGGNRMWTCMIYLNDNFEGGTTNFPNIEMEFKPKRGTALIWQNVNKKGECLEDALHEGKEIINGTKYIITSWIREYSLNQRNLEYTSKLQKFSNYSELPKFTELGFKKIKVPENEWNFILEMYNQLLEFKVEEDFTGKNEIIPSDNGTNSSDIFYLDRIPEQRIILHNNLLELHKDWSNANIIPSFIYGIRSYNNGAKLSFHRDRIETHHISSIICVDKNLGGNEDWALQIEDHSGNYHDVYLEPGEMVLYESARCLHGRRESFKGEFYRNLFVHYKLLDYEFSNQ